MDRLQFYLTIDSPCAYLADRVSANIVPDPAVPLTAPLYDQLIELGFRRSGKHVYRPNCRDCEACVPLRVIVNEFTPRRTDRRLLSRCKSFSVEITRARFEESHYQLFQRYTASRHKDGAMASMSPDEYMGFITSNWSRSWFAEIRDNDTLIAVAVYDQVHSGLSAVYTFFEPDYSTFAPGRFAILWQIEQARLLDLPFVYLGFWIEASPKMAYKIDYQPAEGYINKRWSRINGTG
jgi:arginine-tRNA-protein transferase